jgi:hypothetical protein
MQARLNEIIAEFPRGFEPILGSLMHIPLQSVPHSWLLDTPVPQPLQRTLRPLQQRQNGTGQDPLADLTWRMPDAVPIDWIPHEI